MSISQSVVSSCFTISHYPNLSEGLWKQEGSEVRKLRRNTVEETLRSGTNRDLGEEGPWDSYRAGL